MKLRVAMLAAVGASAVALGFLCLWEAASTDRDSVQREGRDFRRSGAFESRADHHNSSRRSANKRLHRAVAARKRLLRLMRRRRKSTDPETLQRREIERRALMRRKRLLAAHEAEPRNAAFDNRMQQLVRNTFGAFMRRSKNVNRDIKLASVACRKSTCLVEIDTSEQEAPNIPSLVMSRRLFDFARCLPSGLGKQGRTQRILLYCPSKEE